MMESSLSITSISTHSFSVSNLPSATPVPVTLCGTNTYGPGIWKTHLAAGSLNYLDNTNCISRYTAPDSMILKYTELYKQLEQCCDRVLLFNGPSIGSPSLTNTGSVFTTGNELTIQFITDSSIIMTGVIASVEFLDGPTSSPRVSPSSSSRSSRTQSDSPSSSHTSRQTTSQSLSNSPSAQAKESETSMESLSSSNSPKESSSPSASHSLHESSSPSPSQTSSWSPVTHTPFVTVSPSISTALSSTPSSVSSSSPVQTVSFIPSRTFCQTGSISNTASIGPSRSLVSLSPSPSAIPTQRPRGPPPPLPQDVSNLSVSELSGIFQDLSYYDPLLIQSSLHSLGMAALEQSGGSFSISTPAFDLSMKSLPANVSTDIHLPNASLNMPPLSSFGKGLAASMIQWTENPYSKKSSVITDTPTLSISVLNTKGAEVPIHNLSDTIDIHWSLNSSDSRFLPPPSYLINCQTQKIFIQSDSSFQPFFQSIPIAAGSWLVPCFSNSWKAVNCSSETIFQTVECPKPILTPYCLYWNTDLSQWTTDGCIASIINTTIHCSCNHLSDFTSRVQAVAEQNQAIFANAKEVYSLSGLQKYAQWYGIFGGLFLATLALGILSVRIDYITMKKYITSLCQDPIIATVFTNAPNSAIYIYDANSTKQCKKTITKQQPTLQVNYCQRILQQHTRLQFLFRFDPRLSRLFRLLTLFTVQFHTLFVTAFLYGFTYNSSGEMEWHSILLLAVMTSALNIPVVKFTMESLQFVGIKEFECRFPLLCEEYTRRSEFEQLALEYLHRKEKEYQTRTSSDTLDLVDSQISMNDDAEESLVDLCMVYFCCRNKQEANENSLENLSSKQLLVKMIKVIKRKYGGVEVYSPTWEMMPFHTLYGSFFFIFCIGWIGACLNYLLLFAAAHSQNVGEQILISYASSEVSTIVLSQPLTILGTYLLFKCVHTYKQYIPSFLQRFLLVESKKKIPHLYYFSNPWAKDAHSIFTSQFAYSLFIRCPSIASSTNEINYAPLKAIVLEHSDPTKRCEVENLYKTIRSLDPGVTLRSV